MKKILCPTDFSRIGENGVTYAAQLAKRMGATLNLIHVNLLSDTTPEEALAGAGLSNAHWSDVLKKECLEVSNTYNISCYAEPVISVSSVPKRIANLAENFDVVVMGSNGEDNVFQKFFGSTTYRVIKQTGTPVILVPEECTYREIKSIAYAFDYWRILDVPMERITVLAQDLGCSLTLVQVMEAFSHDAEKELRATESFLWDKYSDTVSLSFKTLYDPKVTHALRELMENGGYDALALCFREGMGSHFHTRVIREMSRDIWYPLIAFH
jgi:nucleotide-binding universal stress UspA family protein